MQIAIIKLDFVRFFAGNPLSGDARKKTYKVETKSR